MVEVIENNPLDIMADHVAKQQALLNAKKEQIAELNTTKDILSIHLVFLQKLQEKAEQLKNIGYDQSADIWLANQIIKEQQRIIQLQEDEIKSLTERMQHIINKIK